ncbi:MAG TPA: peptidase M28, partial [Gemmatimonadales bacterium]|nr:peptidase M28 [Gemmatimonadales bacterium]
TAMLAYLASEDSTLITRERVDLAVAAAAAQADTSGTPNRRRFRIPTTWPECQAAPRSTHPRLQ